MSSKLKNPILPGYYPDPSICRVGDDFYLVCSSFELYPGIPIFHSRDLMHWEQIGNVMHMENGFHVERSYGGNGVMAPTIRYHNGTFYIINANFSDRGNFIVTAEDPAGPWSSPHWLEDVPGIDASIFFDDDGQCYMMGTGDCWENGFGVKERGIWLAKYDIEHFQLASEPVTIFNSALRGAGTPESPHIYHIGDYYYLLIAEGGTEHFHCAAVARSRDLFGFYENDPANPVITHRMMGHHARIANVGHADLVDTPDGRWYAVMLASRTQDGRHKNLGRETWICPVEWEDEWPLFSPDTGLLEMEYEGTGLPETIYPPKPERDDFDTEVPADDWCFWGTPYEPYYEIRNSRLNIRCIHQQLISRLEPVSFGAPPKKDAFVPFIAKRQQQFDFDVTLKMEFYPEAQESAGMAIVQALNHQFHFERVQRDGKQYLQLELFSTDFNVWPFLPGFQGETGSRVIACVEYSGREVVLQLQARGREFRFLYGEEEGHLRELTTADSAWVSPAKLGCMTGSMIGMFASGNGIDSSCTASFDWFEMKSV